MVTVVGEWKWRILRLEQPRLMGHVPPTADATHFALRNASLGEELCEIMCQRKDFKAVDKPEKEPTAEAHS